MLKVASCYCCECSSGCDCKANKESTTDIKPTWAELSQVEMTVTEWEKTCECLPVPEIKIGLDN